jgi:hypothetical protein
LSYALLALLLALASYGLATLAAAGLVGLIFRRCRRAAGGAASVRLLFAQRLFPAAAALLVVGLLVVPAYLAHEPLDAQDEIGPLLVALAGLGALPLLIGSRRVLRGVSATRERVARWRRDAVPFELPQSALEALRIRDRFPVVSVVGLLRPRLFVAEQVLATLTPAELAAVYAHEQAHVRSLDNAKTLLMRCCPDWLALLPLGRVLEEAWQDAAEQAADDAAAGPGRARALDLASALVKTARLVPEGARLDSLPVSALLGGSLAARVERLMREPAPGAGSRAAWLVLASCLLALLGAAAVPGLHGDVHALIEQFVRLTSGAR